MNDDSHYVYIVRCADGTFYTGYARDPFARELTHNRGRGARYTRSRLPVELVWSKRVATRSRALSLEATLKQLSRAQKLQLVRHGRPVSITYANAKPATALKGRAAR